MFTKSPRLMYVLLLLGLSACGAADEGSSNGRNGQSDPSTRSLESNIIVGTRDWVSTTSLPASSTQRTRSKAVGILQYGFEGANHTGKHSHCTAWLASKDVVITNGHCIDTDAKAHDVRVSFNYEEGVSKHEWYDCSTFIRSWGDGHDDHEDITALRCKPINGVYPGEKYSPLKVSAKDVAQNTSIYVIHQSCADENDDAHNDNCDPTKKYSPGKVLDPGDSTHWLRHDADTMGGSSGSPLLSLSSHEVVGLNRGNLTEALVNAAMPSSVLRSHLVDIGL